MGKLINFNDYLFKKELVKIKLSKKDIMNAKKTLLSDDDYDLYEDIKKNSCEELKEM
ncbi:MAG: hypothetical protein KAX49_00070 [Halanaerobiales bacterium]|nr:hypothetical protein [Halanaerobiales bacterium]